MIATKIIPYEGLKQFEGIDTNPKNIEIATKIIPYEGLKLEPLLNNHHIHLIATKIIPYEGLKLGGIQGRSDCNWIATKIIPYEGLKPLLRRHRYPQLVLQIATKIIPYEGLKRAIAVAWPGDKYCN